MISHLHIAAPTGDYPITLDQAKAWVIDVMDEDDEIIQDLIAAAADDIEHPTKLILRKGAAMVYATCWPSCIFLEHRPINSITKIEYQDPNGDTHTLDSTHYQIITKGLLTEIRFKDVRDIAIKEGDVKAITVTLDVGYDDAGEDETKKAPAWIRRLMRGLVALHYEYRNTPPEKMQEAIENYLWKHTPPAI